MAASTYTPPEWAQIKTCAVDFDSRALAAPLHLVQYDRTMPVLEVELYRKGEPYAVPAGADINIRMDKKDGHHIYSPALGLSADRTKAYIAVTPQMTTTSGTLYPIIEVMANGGVASTSPLRLQFDPNPVPEDAITSSDEYKTLEQIVADVNNAVADAAASSSKAAQSEQSAASSASSANAAASAAASSKQAAAASETAAQEAAQQTATDKEAAEQSATRAESAAKTAGDAAAKVINEGVAEKLTEMQGIQEDVKARQQDVTEKQADVTANVELARQAALSNGYMQMGVDPDTGHLMYTRTTNLKDKLDFAIVNDTNLEVTIHG